MTSTALYYIDMNPEEILAYRQRSGCTGDLAKVLAGQLSSARQEKIRSLRFEEDRLLSLGAGLLMDYGLSRYGLRERQVLMGYKGNQKPCLPDHPHIFFNLSHSGTIAMAAFGSRELGCDVEQIKKADYKVAARFFAEGEQQYLERISCPEEKNTAFYRLWTLKESLIKATGDGIRMPLNQFCIRLEDPEHIYAEAGGQMLPYQFWEYSLPGCRAALCMEKPRDQEIFLCPKPVLSKITLDGLGL